MGNQGVSSMYISAVSSNNSQPNFEACYVNKKAIKRSFGPTILNQVEKVLPEIKELSVDVDTFIFPYNFGFFNRNNGIKVVVQKINVSFWDKLLSRLSLRPPYEKGDFVFSDHITNNTVGLLASFKNAKENLSKYM